MAAVSLGAGGKVSLDLYSLGGERYHCSVQGTALVEAVAKKLQKQHGWAKEPVLIADGQILDGQMQVQQFGSSCWQLKINHSGVQLANWKPKLSRWQQHPILRREVRVDSVVKYDLLGAVPMGADRLLIFFQPDEVDDSMYVRPSDIWIIDAREPNSEDTDGPAHRQLPLPLADMDTHLHLVYFDGASMFAIKCNFDGNQREDVLLQFDLMGATSLNFDEPHFLQVSEETLDVQISSQHQFKEFLKSRGVQPFDFRAHCDFRVERVKGWIMPTESRRGHEQFGAKVFHKRSGKQVGEVSIEHDYNGSSFFEDVTDGRILFDQINFGREDSEGFSGLRVFDLSTGLLLQKCPGLWLPCNVDWRPVFSGLLPGDSQSFFDACSSTPDGTVLVTFYTPDPTATLADQEASTKKGASGRASFFRGHREEAARNAENMARRQADAARVQAEKAERQRRADLVEEYDENPHLATLTAIQRAMTFCQSVCPECSTKGTRQPQGTPVRHGGRRAMGNNRSIKHTIDSIALFSTLQLPVPTIVGQIPETFRKLEARLLECNRMIDCWEGMDKERAAIKRRILNEGSAPVGMELLRLAFGFNA